MNESLESQLREFGTERLGQSPRRFNMEEEKYGLCPLLWRYAEAASDNSWFWEERLHISRCPYCQASIAMQWALPSRCPQDNILTAYLNEIGTFRQAIERHVEEDGCAGCRSRMDDLENAVNVAAVVAFPMLVGNHGADPTPPLQFHRTSAGGSLITTLYEDKGMLQLKLRCPEPPAVSPKTARVKLIHADGTVRIEEINLEPADELGSLGWKALGEFSRFQRDFQVETEWIR